MENKKTTKCIGFDEGVFGEESEIEVCNLINDNQNFNKNF